ncbi:hypothetical protein Mterra_02257 [Calidithermus terrae]|uniref:Uncharacterized protein n=2 Tax=Calidithermus terrae TaxID=1408545 RepID=A0A399EJQ4_9DEIN|nr:hypothetical protein Mterra_02257 [Calidithermus terrae]
MPMEPHAAVPKRIVSKGLFDLGQGLLLEDLGQNLPWGCSTGTARLLLGPEHQRPDRETMVWNPVRCLDGLECHLTGKFLRDEPDERRRLRMVEFVPYEKLKAAVVPKYLLVRQHLVGLLGEPTLEQEPGDSVVGTFSRWDTEAYLVLWKVVSKRGLEHCVGQIWPKPLPGNYLEMMI